MKELVIDVSRWDDDVDFGSWRDMRGLWGVIIKCGGNEGGRYTDSWFERNYTKAKAAGLHIGAYYYTKSISENESKLDAEHCISILNGRSFDLPIYIDVEDYRQANIGKRALTDVVLTFINTVNNAGYRGGIYTSGSWWQDNVYANELRPYANWIAWWTDSKPPAISDVGMWQFGSMRLRDGDIIHDDIEGYTDSSWCYVNYPGGESMGKLTVAERTAQTAEIIANNDAHGYSQPNRMGDGTEETIKYSDSSTAVVHGGDYDCSEDVRTCVNCALTGHYSSPIEYMWTGNEDDELTAYGFVRMPFSYSGTKRGDILLVSGHTGIALGNGLQADAHGDEQGGITGPQQGDQTGHEIEVRDLQTYWTWTYRYVGEESHHTGKYDQTEDEMYCTIHLNGDKTSDGRALPMVYFDGQALHPIAHKDELAAIREVYRKTHGGSELPDIVLGDQKNPFGSRLVSLVKRTVWPYADPNKDLKGLV